MQKYIKIVSFGLVLFFSITGLAVNAHNPDPETTTVRAEVVKVVSQEVQESPGINVKTEYQVIRAKILEGEREGQIVTVEEDFEGLDEGDKFFLNILETPEGGTIYGVNEFDRRGVLLGFFTLFVLAVVLLGKWKGVRS
ncbi:MAG: hypothetical protein R3346_03285, partial [Candidatus Spechtbacterales bacterium]|nr:hypothetical protein [Candidatus Spechtbacterales bacterium]